MVINDKNCTSIGNYMGSVTSCIRETVMSLFSRQPADENDGQAQLERKLYIAKESPEPEFDLSECHLNHVPSGIYSLCKVYRKEYLYLHSNKLRNLEEGGQLSDLYLIKVLNLSCNRFSKISNDIKYLINLTELYIQNNCLESLPDNIEYLQSLQILDVSNNMLTRLTPSTGKLKKLRTLNITGNKLLNELCPELSKAINLMLIQLDGEQFKFPPPEIATKDTPVIMKFLCEKMNIEYIPPSSEEIVVTQYPSTGYNPFVKPSTTTWEEQEAAMIEQESKIHKAAQVQREKFLTTIIQEQHQLDTEVAKVQEARDLDRQRLVKAIQEDEKEIACLVKHFIMSDRLTPEVIQQQLAYEQAEHERLLEITKQNYDDIKKADVLKAMEELLDETYSIYHSKKTYEDSLNMLKQNMLMDDIDGSEKINDLLKAKDQSHTVLVEQLLEDQDIQKAIVASLLERVDAKSWSLNQEISLISAHLARLSTIEQEKRKLHVSYNFNELLQQRIQLVNLLDDLFEQQIKRRDQLIQTLKDMENEMDKTTDFWLKNYQKVIDSAPKNLLSFGKSLDPLLANYLLQENVIHCLPFLVKFLFADESLLTLDAEKLKRNGVSLSADREGILKAIRLYVDFKTNAEEPLPLAAPSAPGPDSVEQHCTGVISSTEAEGSILDSECVICMDSKCEVVFIPCGHMCCCQLCSDPKMETCPMCRSTIERSIKVMIP